MSHLVSGKDASLGKRPASWLWRFISSHTFRPVRSSLVHKSVHTVGVQVISSVGHPAGYPGFFGATRVCPPGRSK
jgi:hypothetical protein